MTENSTTPDSARTIVFYGDSLIEDGRWEERFDDAAVRNLGRSGATSDDALQELDAVIDARPDEVVLLVGTNDIDRRSSVEHVVRNVETILVTLRRELPEAHLLIVSILPRASEYAERVRDANRHLRQFVATVHGGYADAWPVLALEDGELDPRFSDDRLHLNDEGYAALAEEIRSELEALRSAPPRTGVITLPRQQ